MKLKPIFPLPHKAHILLTQHLSTDQEMNGIDERIALCCPESGHCPRYFASPAVPSAPVAAGYSQM